MVVVIDTNVLYQALRSREGASHFILQLIRGRKITLALSLPVFTEYEDVLKRPDKLNDLQLTKDDIDKVLRFLSYISKPVTIYYLFRPNLKDEKDNIFLELSLAGNCDFIITSNTKDFTKYNELKFDDISVITPSDFVKMWRKNYEV
ncbi:MAG TPA: putative toxin-antitoxin system toxin component, PIN family [Spirochaetota bacterium]|nr:putative toxin-antitoxin system toxin component, PIN family [Spirochaetota bacterium]HOR45595.1 putative toxin-antitoxin system toxin component, PIN family [Spirochaetota bacterium]HPK55175.1 putative toxin-antitoxin system toxin component, PIN family [Spirochaetota bacterium]